MNISERIATGLRTAHLSARQFATVVGCHFTTISRIIREDDPSLQAALQGVLERRLDRLEELIETGHLPFDHGIPRKDKKGLLLSLFADKN
jgi:hypothetical protein